MKCTRNLVTGLIGLAMLAAPITAAAKDNDSGRNNSHQERVEARHEAPSRNSAPAPRNEIREQHSARVETRNVAPAPRIEMREQRSARVETRNEAPAVRNDFRENRENARSFNRGQMIMPAPKVEPARREAREERHEANRDWRADRHEANRDRREDRREANRDWRAGRDNDHDGWNRYRGYRDYDHDDYDHDREYAAGGWIMPRGYYGGACGWAQHLRNVYRHDLRTGHPAAAQDVLWQLRRAERSCGGVPYGYNTYRYRY
jgi:hypothetical protein